MGELGILNVGAGDTKISFDPSDPEGMKRAARIVTDMLRKGFVLLVHVGEREWNGRSEPVYVRAHAFDERTCEYIIADDQPEKPDGRSKAKKAAVYSDRNPQRTRRVHASHTTGVSVGRTSGG